MNKIIIAIVSLMVGALVFTASLPIFDSLTMTSTAEYNEGMLDLRYDLVDSHKMYTIVIDYDEINDVLTLTNGTDVQNFTGDNLEFFYSDDNVSVLSAEGSIFLVGKDTNDNVSYIGLDEVPITITRTNNGVSIECDGETYTYGAPTYAYIPLKTGKYATFPNEQPIVTNSTLKDAFFGYYAGVYTYNGMNTQNLALYLNKSYDENDNLDGATWETTEPEEPAPDSLDIIPFDPGQIQLNPIDIDPIDLDPGAQLMAVPTPTYTDGVWGYDLDGSNNAIIVSYSGTAGDITVPATVGGYPVTEFGKGGGDNQVFDTTLGDFNVTLSEGITKINYGAFYGCTNLKEVVLPSTMETVGNNVFKDCSNLYTLVILSQPTFSNTSFANTGIKEILNLGGGEITTTSYGLNADSVQDYIGALVFIGNTELTISTQNTGPVYTFISMLPLIMVLGIVLVSIGLLLYRRV